MARISGVDIPREKRVIVALTYIHGIGPTSTNQILKAANVSEDTRVRDLTEDGSISAHFENTIAVTDAGPEVLTGR